jgi:hypothetical protein
LCLPHSAAQLSELESAPTYCAPDFTRDGAPWKRGRSSRRPRSAAGDLSSPPPCSATWCVHEFGLESFSQFGPAHVDLTAMVEINDGARFRWGMRWTKEGDGYDTRAHLISEATDIGQPNRFRVQFRPGSYSSGYKQPGFGVGSFQRTTCTIPLHSLCEGDNT